MRGQRDGACGWAQVRPTQRTTRDISRHWGGSVADRLCQITGVIYTPHLSVLRMICTYQVLFPSIAAVATNYFRSANPRQGFRRDGWEKPREGFVKLNVDASFSIDDEVGGYGGCSSRRSGFIYRWK